MRGSPRGAGDPLATLGDTCQQWFAPVGRPAVGSVACLRPVAGEHSKLCCVNLKIDRKLISKVVTSCIDNPAEKMIAVGIIWLESTDCDGVGIG